MASRSRAARPPTPRAPGEPLAYVVAGAALDVASHYLRSLESLAAEAGIGVVHAAEEILATDIHRSDISAWFLASTTAPRWMGKGGQDAWEATFASAFGLCGPVYAHDRAGQALHAALRHIAAGGCRFAIVGAFEKCSDEHEGEAAADRQLDPVLRLWGWNWRTACAWQAARYAERHGFEPGELHAAALFDALQAAPPGTRADAVRARLAKAALRPAADPLTQADFAPTGRDGAAFVLLAAPELGPLLPAPRVAFYAAAEATAPSEFWTNPAESGYPALRAAAARAFAAAACTPGAVRLAALDNACAALAPLVLEETGLIAAPAIHALQAASAGLEAGPYDALRPLALPRPDAAPLVVNPAGGAAATGGLGGAAGLYRLTTLVEQLRAAPPEAPRGPSALLHEQAAAGACQALLLVGVAP